MQIRLRRESDENFLEWILNPEGKLKQFEEIKEHMKLEYLADPFDFVVAFSGGKDSTLVATLLWEMLEELPPEKRHKKVHIVSSDTLVETKKLSDHLYNNLELMATNGKHLGIEVHLVQPTPKQGFFRHVIGLGVMPPAPGKGFQWCTDRMKIKPMSAKMKDILARQPIILPEPSYYHRLTIILGTRLDESQKRANSIERHTDGYFGIHDYVPLARTYMPIKYVSTDDLWNYLRYNRTHLPWGTPLASLESLYGSSTLGECPVIRSKKELTYSCGGNSRNGCWTCLMGGREDKMLLELMQKGDPTSSYLSEWKQFLWDVNFDVRYKDPIKRVQDMERHVSATREGGFLEDKSLWYSNEFERYVDEYERYERAWKGNEKGEYDPGKFTFELRRMLLEKLLYTQEKVGYSLISDDELTLILEEWAKEGFHVSKDDLRPINHQHDGAVVLRRDWTVNEKETTNPNPIFFVKVKLNMSASELAVYHKNRQRLTGRSIFCFYDHQDFSHAKSVINEATFLVCREGITNQKQATEYVHQWFFLDGQGVIGEGEQAIPKMSDEAFHAAINFLMVDSLVEAFGQMDEQISHIRKNPQLLETITTEHRNIAKKWLLFQRWIRLEQHSSVEECAEQLPRTGEHGQLEFQL